MREPAALQEMLCVHARVKKPSFGFGKRSNQVDVQVETQASEVQALREEMRELRGLLESRLGPAGPSPPPSAPSDNGSTDGTPIMMPHRQQRNVLKDVDHVFVK